MDNFSLTTKRIVIGTSPFAKAAAVATLKTAAPRFPSIGSKPSGAPEAF
jgi:hypothetical protein